MPQPHAPDGAMPAAGPAAGPAAVPSARPFADARAQALEDAVDLAHLAPSVHNTQPWTFELEGDRLALRADRSRQLSVIDPLGRSLAQSVGAALFNARVAVAAAGWAADVSRLPRPDDPDLLAEIRPVRGRPDGDLAGLARMIRRRTTNRRRFAPEPVPEDALRQLSALVAEEATRLVPVLREDHRALLAGLTQEADRAQNADPAYRAELRRWTSRTKAEADGVPASAVPRTGGRQHDAVPIRDFDTSGTGALPAETASDPHQTLVLLATATDDPLAWLRCGEALERVLLELTRLGWVASPVMQAIEVSATRARLRAALTGQAHPQMVLRIGRAAPTPATPRRRRADVVSGSARPPEPAAVRARPGPPPVEGPLRPVADGRGGTVWIR
jgi:hypothetical protein